MVVEAHNGMSLCRKLVVSKIHLWYVFADFPCMDHSSMIYAISFLFQGTCTFWSSHHLLSLCIHTLRNDTTIKSSGLTPEDISCTGQKTAIIIPIVRVTENLQRVWRQINIKQWSKGTTWKERKIPLIVVTQGPSPRDDARPRRGRQGSRSTSILSPVQNPQKPTNTTAYDVGSDASSATSGPLLESCTGAYIDTIAIDNLI